MLLTPGRPLVALEAMGHRFLAERLVALGQRPDVDHPRLRVSLAERRALVPEERVGEALLAAGGEAQLVGAGPDHALRINYTHTINIDLWYSSRHTLIDKVL